jgi:hypothetical protein
METNRNRLVPEEAWSGVLHDLRRLGATPGEVLCVADMVEAGLSDVALALVNSAFERLRSEQL